MDRHTFHIELTEGMDYSVPFVYQDKVTGLPIPLTGYTADMKVRVGMNGTYDAEQNPDFVLEFTDTTGIVLGGTAGTVTLNITAAQTTGLNWNRGNYNLVLISPTGQRIPFVGGFFTILGSTT